MVNKILLMIVITGLFLGAVIITAGAVMIYNSKEDGIRSEIHTAGRTLGNLYDAEYNGDLSYDGSTFMAGGKPVEVRDFVRIINYIDCEDDIDFTLFYKDTRVFTSVQNIDGTFAVGTKAANDVTENVLTLGNEYLSNKVLVNDVYYMGYYKPIISDDGEITGMLFAGKPLESAVSTAADATIKFIVLAIVTLIISLGCCFVGSQRMLADFSVIKQYLAKLAQGDFSASLPEKTVQRKDEVGEISKHIVKVHKNLRDMVERDPLTSLLNRRSCKNRMDNLIISDSEGYSVVMGDIDFFKKINDTYGHAAGDYVLKNISDILERYCHENDGFAARWGGEEFLVIVPGCGLVEARQLAERIRKKIESQKDEQKGVTISIGVAAYNGGNYNEDVKKADMALYEAKNNGRNRVCVYREK